MLQPASSWCPFVRGGSGSSSSSRECSPPIHETLACRLANWILEAHFRRLEH